MPSHHVCWLGTARCGTNGSCKLGNPITGAYGLMAFALKYFADIGKKDLAEYFATWSAYLIRRVNAMFIGWTAIYRPKPDLLGIKGTRDTYVFVGANTPTPDASTATRLGKKAEVPDVVARIGFWRREWTREWWRGRGSP